MNWSDQQIHAIDAVKLWLANKHRSQIFRLFGYAGTGKTTLAKHLATDVKGSVLYASFTGKAAQVLRNRGCEGATTIHSLIYKPHRDPITGTVEFYLNHDSILGAAELLIVDEVSMVGEELARDLLSFGVPILVLGDPAQLPPVKSAGFFINEKPDILLTEVHRQAAENPIIRISMDVRNGLPLTGPVISEAGSVQYMQRSMLDSKALAKTCLSYDQILCGRNATRTSINKIVRNELGRKNAYPEVGDRLVCLRNDHTKGIFNGSLWEVAKIRTGKDQNRTYLDIKSLDSLEDIYVDVEVRKEFFTGREADLPWQVLRGSQQFTYGYALTVHKSQGSQWDNVLLFDESPAFGDDAIKHLYTGVTRAAINLMVIR